MARPSEYTQEKADKICEQLAQGISLRTVCASKDMPSAVTVFAWMRENDEFLKQYERAKAESSDALNEVILDLGDEAITKSQQVDFKASNAVVSAYKLKADNLKWYMSKMKPKKYGDKLDLTTNGKDLPTPILANVPSNNSPQADKGAQ